MNDPERRDDEAIDRLVRGYLDRAAETTDATALLPRILAARSQPERAEAEIAAVPRSLRPAGRRRSRALVWCASTAAVVVIAFLGGRHLGSDSANAAVVLRDMQSVHSQAVDRCYRVQYAPDPRHWNRKNKFEGPSQSVLWTRGDRFWSDCSIGDIRLNIGRERDGTIWISPSPNKGIRFTADESQLPGEVALICAINSMSVPRLVDDVLADFDLRGGRPAEQGERTVIWAALKPGRSHPLLARALLEIDGRSNVLNRLVLWMVRDGRPRGTVTFTLLESARRSDEQYQLASHLDADAEIEHHTFQPTAREERQADK